MVLMITFNPCWGLPHFLSLLSPTGSKVLDLRLRSCLNDGACGGAGQAVQKVTSCM